MAARRHLTPRLRCSRTRFSAYKYKFCLCGDSRLWSGQPITLPSCKPGATQSTVGAKRDGFAGQVGGQATTPDDCAYLALGVLIANSSGNASLPADGAQLTSDEASSEDTVAQVERVRPSSCGGKLCFVAGNDKGIYTHWDEIPEDNTKSINLQNSWNIMFLANALSP